MPTEHDVQASDLNARFRVEKYGYRSFAVYDKEQLVVVTVYKRGAIEVAKRLETFTGGGIKVRKTERISDYINPFH